MRAYHDINLATREITTKELTGEAIVKVGRYLIAKTLLELGAATVDPLSPAINAMMCYSLYYERRYKEAIAFSRHASALDSSFAAPGCVRQLILLAR